MNLKAHPKRLRCWIGKNKIGLLLMSFGMLVMVVVFFYTKHKPSVTPDDLPLVVIGKVSEQVIPRVVSSFGNLIAPNSAMLKAKQVSTVAKIYFVNGQKVQAGDLLVQFDDAANRALYDRDNALFIKAQVKYERYQRLNQLNPTAVSKVQMDELYADFQSAKATLAADRKSLVDMQIHAPFTGVLGASNVAVGSFLDVGDEIVLIVDPEQLEISYPVPEVDFSQVHLGQTVNFTTDAYPNQQFSATIQYKDPVVDANSRSFNVRAKVNTLHGLAPGLLVYIKQVLPVARPVLAVNTEALVPEMGGFSIYQLKHNKVIKKYVEIGRQFGSLTEITSGLAAGDEIIIQGGSKVQPGMTVKVARS